MKTLPRRFPVVAAAVCLSLGLLPATVRAQEYGTVTGQFVLDGDPIKLDALVKAGDTSAKDAAVCAKDGVPDDSLIVDPTSKGIANVFIYLAKAPSDIHPDLKASKEPVVKFDQKGCRFTPHALIVRTDQDVAILSGDPIAHNTHVFPIRNDNQNQTIPGNDRSGSVKWKFALPERTPSRVNCDIHTWMRAYWLIIDHPYAAVSDKEGKFTIEKIPAGTHNFMVWQERSEWLFGPQKKSIKVTVKPNETTDLGVIKIPATTFAK
ncbi:MAG TPA: hypothetical protein VEI07_24175 [Planctomycetaceae bacterium]|nr:hypothetical protein [Planctomycetaceae bacterium]